MKLRAVVLFFLLLLPLCLPAEKYIFVFIGDGMGPEHLKTGELASRYIRNIPAAWEDFPVKGQLKTNSFGGKTTDSAAAATALFCGKKTENSSIGVDENGNTLPNIADFAAAAGKKVGVISTVALNDATPAAMYAHVKKRIFVNDILKQLPNGKIALIFGSSPKKLGNIVFNHIDFLNSKGFTTVKDDLNNFFALTPANLPAYAEFPMDYYRKRDFSKAPPLPFMLQKAIELLENNPDGFLIMTESGSIDRGAHANNFSDVVFETLELSDAVAVAKDFMKKHPDDTLIILTADHETGSLVLDANKKDWDICLKKIATPVNGDYPVERKPDGVKWGGYGHSSRNVPLRAVGKNAVLFAGEKENTSLAETLKKILKPTPAEK